MKKILFFVVLISSMVFAGNNIILKKKVFKIPADILMGSISTIDIDEKERLLVCDHFGRGVYLFTIEGKLIAKLDPSSKHKIKMFEPYQAFFRGDKKIVVVTLFDGSFLFDENGVCLQKLSTDLQYNDNNAPYMYNGCVSLSSIDAYFKMQVFNEKGEARDLFRIKPEFPNLLFRNKIGGVTSDKEGNIYYAEKFAPRIVKYSKEGKFINAFFLQPPYYTKVTSDIKFEMTAENLKKIVDLSKEASQVISLDCPDGENIFYQVLSAGQHYFQIVDRNGNYLLPGFCKLDEPVKKAKNNYLISVKNPIPSNTKKKVNPQITIYTIKYKGK